MGPSLLVFGPPPPGSTLTSPRPVRAGQAAQAGWALHLAPPRGIRARALTRLCPACLPGSSDWECPFRVAGPPSPQRQSRGLRLSCRPAPAPSPIARWPEHMCEGGGSVAPRPQGCRPQKGREKTGFFPFSETVSLTGQCLLSETYHLFREKAWVLIK